MHQQYSHIPYAPMFDNIRGQVPSARQVLRQQTTSGYATLARCGMMLRMCQGRIVISGMGASYFAAMPVAQVMEGHGMHVLLAESSELLHYGCSSYGSKDVAILISRSGGSVEVLRLAEQMTTAGVRVICVTNVPASPLVKHAAETIVLGSMADQLIAVQTYTGTFLALLLLAEQAATGTALALAEAAEEALPGLENLIETSLERSDSWEDFLTSAQPMYLLARGSALATAHAGALLFHETAKASAVVLSSGQFRHGPVEAVSSSFRAIVLGTPEPTRKLDWSLASDLQTMGANVRWIGPQNSADPPQTLTEWPDDIPSLLQPMFDVIPLQVAAYRLAWWKGFTPGDFRYASEVTADESGFPLYVNGAFPASTG